MVDVLTTSNPGSGGSDKTHYDRENQYLNETTVKSSVNKLGKKALEVIVAACCAGREFNTLAGIRVARGLYPRNAANK